MGLAIIGGRMRLGPHQVATIKRLVAEAYGDTAVVRLFGSQVDDSRKGGDIDLLVEVGPKADADLATELRLRSRLSEALDDRKVDLVLHIAGHRPPAIVQIAIEEGVVL
jgi:predicted nucleotidyltransferase